MRRDSNLPKPAAKYEFGETNTDGQWVKLLKLKIIATTVGSLLLWFLCIVSIVLVFIIAYFAEHGHVTLLLIPPVIVGLWTICMFFAILEAYLNIALFAINIVNSIIYATILTVLSVGIIVVGILTATLARPYSLLVVQVFPSLLTSIVLMFWVVETDESRPRDSFGVNKQHPLRQLLTQQVHNIFLFVSSVYGIVLVLLGFYQSIAIPFCVFAIASSFEVMDSPVTNSFRLNEREMLAELNADDEDVEDSHKGLLNPEDVEEALYQSSKENVGNIQEPESRFKGLSPETVEDRRRSVQSDRKSHSMMHHTLSSYYEYMTIGGTVSNKILRWLLLLVLFVVVSVISAVLSHGIPLLVTMNDTPYSRGEIIVVGHRGMGNRDDTPKGVPPENTLAAFRTAIGLGANRVELDVQMSKDGHLIVMHDYNVDRTTNGTGNLIDLTLAEIKALSIKTDNPRYANETVPTYQEVIDLLKSPDNIRRVNLTTEIKFAYRYAGRNLERAVYEATKENGFLDRVNFLSLDGSPLSAVRSFNANATLIRLYILGQQSLAPPIPYDANIVGSSAEHIVLDPWVVLKAHNAGRKVYVWFEKGTESPEYARYMANIGVDHLCVYEVGNVIKALKE